MMRQGERGGEIVTTKLEEVCRRSRRLNSASRDPLTIQLKCGCEAKEKEDTSGQVVRSVETEYQ